MIRTQPRMAETPEALVLRALARHELIDTDLPDMLDLWPEVTCERRSFPPKPSTVRRHQGQRICDRCNHWSRADTYPHGGGVCRACVMQVVA